MAERRMFAKSVIDSDEFLDMPQEAQLLYFHLSMRADDDGFITPKKVMRLIGARDDSLKILIAKSFIVPFSSGVIVIKHWAINNLIRKDRYVPTIYQEEKKELETISEASVNQRLTQDSIGKDSIGKDSIGKDSIGKDSIEISNSSSKEDSLSISCGETSEKVSPPNEKAPEQEAIFLFMPLRTVDENGNSEEVGIPVSWVESMKNLYPDLDVEGEVRKAVAWCLNNPKARKTSAGWQRYLNAWLTRAVDKKSQFPNFEEQKELKRKQEREESIRRGEELERIYGKTLRL